MIKHIVMWNLIPELKNEAASRIKAELEALKNTIPEISFIEVGVNFEQSDMAYDLVLYSEFASKEALDTYQNHPEHKKVAAYVASVRTARVVADYEV